MPIAVRLARRDDPGDARRRREPRRPRDGDPVTGGPPRRLVRPPAAADVAGRGRPPGRGRRPPPALGPATASRPARCRRRRGRSPTATFRSVLARGRTRSGAGGRRSGGRPRPPTGCSTGRWEALGVLRPDSRGTGLVPRPGRPAGPRPRTARVPGRAPGRGRDRQRQAGLGAVAAPPPHGARRGLVAHRGRALRRGRRPGSCARGGLRTRSCPACTGRAGSRSVCGSSPGPGSAGCSTTGPRSATSSRARTTRSGRSAGTASTSPRSRAAARPRTTTSSPRRPGCSSAASAFDWFPRSARWRADAARLLERELAANTFPSGVNRELATDYHRFVARARARRRGRGGRRGAAALPVDVAARRADPSTPPPPCSTVPGAPPRQGDGDEGRALVVDDPEGDPWSAVLGAGAALVGPMPWWPAAPAASVESVVLGATGRRHPVDGPERASRRPRGFADAGLTVLRSRAEDGPELWCRCDGGPHGFGSIAAHGHADALSIEVRYDGVELLADPGTYCYHGEPVLAAVVPLDARRTTRSSSRGVDQSRSGGPFLWMPHARYARASTSWSAADGEITSWCGGARRIRRLDPPATHRRTVSPSTASPPRTTSSTRSTPPALHPVRLAFHFGPVGATPSGSTRRWHEPRALLAGLRPAGAPATLLLPAGAAVAGRTAARPTRPRAGTRRGSASSAGDRRRRGRHVTAPGTAAGRARWCSMTDTTPIRVTASAARARAGRAGARIRDAGAAHRVVIATIMPPAGTTGVQTHIREVQSYLETSGREVTVVHPRSRGTDARARGVRGPRVPLSREPAKPASRGTASGTGGSSPPRCAARSLAATTSSSTRSARLAARAARSTRAADPHQRVVMAVHFDGSQADEWVDKELIREGGRVYRRIRDARTDRRFRTSTGSSSCPTPRAVAAALRPRPRRRVVAGRPELHTVPVRPRAVIATPPPTS